VRRGKWLKEVVDGAHVKPRVRLLESDAARGENRVEGGIARNAKARHIEMVTAMAGRRFGTRINDKPGAFSV